ncbi:MAG: hypothetical protein RMY63_14515 [Nostoc sp. ChiQUE01b]|nr:hypothetical protein [Nostoc sp. ChiQUE01b]
MTFSYYRNQLKSLLGIETYLLSFFYHFGAIARWCNMIAIN